MPASSLRALRTPAKGVLVVFCEDGLKFGPATRKALAPAGDLVRRAAEADRFTGKSGTALEIVAPAGLTVARLMVVGRRQGPQAQAPGFRQARRRRHGQGSRRRPRTRSSRNCPAGALKPEQAADFALGTQLRAYAFDRYKTKREADETGKPQSPSRSPTPRRRERRGRARRRSPTASSWRATWSTSRPTCCIRRSSPAARRALKKLGVEVEMLDARR